MKGGVPLPPAQHPEQHAVPGCRDAGCRAGERESPRLDEHVKRGVHPEAVHERKNHVRWVEWSHLAQHAFDLRRQMQTVDREQGDRRADKPRGRGVLPEPPVEWQANRGPQHEAWPPRAGARRGQEPDQADRDQVDEEREVVREEDDERRRVIEDGRGPENPRHRSRQMIGRASSLSKDVQEHRAKQRQEELGREVRGGRVEAVGPARHREPGEEKADEIQDGPPLSPCQIHGAGDQDGGKGEERYLDVGLAADHERCEEAAADGGQRETE